MNENEGVRVRDARCCLLCGCEGTLLYTDLRDRLFGAPGNWELMQCTKCQLVWLNPRPVPEDIGKLYGQYFTHDVKNNVSRIASLRRMVRDTVLAISLNYDNLAGSLPQKLIGRVLLPCIGPIKEMAELSVRTLDGQRKGKLLDVGCGNGQFLTKMRDLGWEVMGVEPDGQAVRVARECFGLSVYQGMIEEAGFPDDTFDAITMNHVIEHVSDPIGILRECHRVLKPGGKLVVITPNIESSGAHHFGKNWIHWDPPRHMYLFSLQALQACAGRAGLKALKLRTTSNQARWAWVTSRLIHQNGTLPGGSPEAVGLLLRLEGLAFQAAEYRRCDREQAGEELVLVATK